MSATRIRLRIATGFHTGSQWLSAGVELDAGAADAADWIARGLAVAVEGQGTSAPAAAAPDAAPARPRGKKGAA